MSMSLSRLPSLDIKGATHFDVCLIVRLMRVSTSPLARDVNEDLERMVLWGDYNFFLRGLVDIHQDSQEFVFLCLFGLSFQ